ncbi:MAG TPA: large conductance mechanosensitive channel protein MscL, partial [Anaerolineales bacterium]
MLKEFREFAMRGNVVDLAVGVIIGVAFGRIVTSLVDDIIMPVVGVFTGGIDFSQRATELAGSEENLLRWGAFVQSIIDFLIVAFIIFLIVRAMNRLKRD